MGVLTGAIRELVALTPSFNRYVVVGCTCGAAASFLSPLTPLTAETSFALGFLLPMGPIYWWCNRISAVEVDLNRWKQWEADKRITPSEARELRQVTLQAMVRHRYGGKPDEPPRP